MNYATQVDIGRMRREDGINEDSVSAHVFEERHRDRDHAAVGAFVLADGAGGYDGGDFASYVATTTVQEELSDVLFQLALGDTAPFEDLNVDEAARRSKPTHEEIDDALLAAISKTGDRISEVTARGARASTTVTVALYARGWLHLAWVGDSPAYLVNSSERTIEQVTRDHAQVAEMIDDGELDETVARVYPRKNVVDQLVGSGEFTPETRHIPLYGDDILFMTSDGLLDAHSGGQRLYEEYLDGGDDSTKERIRDLVVTEEEIRDTILSNGSDFELAIEQLVQKGNSVGGEDNMSMVLFQDASRPTKSAAGQEDLARGYRASVDDPPPITDKDTVPVENID